MPRTRALARLFVFIGLAMFVADSISAQVVIRERVEVDAAQAGVATQSPAAHLGGDEPVRGYYVYKPRVTSGFKSVGAPLAGTINITTTEGIFYSADVAPGFLASADPNPITYNCEGDPNSPYVKTTYAAAAGIEILRVPVMAGEFIAESYVNTAGVDVYFSTPGGGANVGCNLSVEHQVRCNCFANWAHEIVSIFFMIDRAFEGAEADTLDVELASESIPCGDSTAVTVVARDSLGSEVPFDAEELVTITVDGPHALLSYADSTSTTFEVPYEEVRNGVVELITLDCEELTETTTVTLTVEAAGLSGTTEIEIEPSSPVPSLALEFRQNGNPVDPATYLPNKDDVLKVTARLVDGPPDATGDVTFQLTQADDFEFDGTGGPGPVPVALQNGEATISIKSLTWWGVATVQADYDLDGVPLSVDQQIPVDIDGDRIADAWEMMTVNGGRLDIAQDGNNQDGMWDDESTPGNTNDGDSFSKLEEYQGALRGGAHFRLLPTEKEVFLDIRGASAGTFVVAEIQNQLGLKVYEVDGVVGQSGGRLHIPAPGPDALEYISPTTRFRGAQGVVFVEDATVATPGSTNPSDITENGLVIQNGAYTITGSSTPPSSYRLEFGVNVGSTAGSGGMSRIYAGTIDNIWHNNDIPEHHRTTFAYNRVVVSSGPARWTADYNNSDLNGDGDVMDPINPFELLSPSSTNDPAMDGVVAALTEQQYLERVTLHEVGHALGMSPGNRHPISGLSVMRSGPGPARVSTFSAADIAQVKLK